MNDKKEEKGNVKSLPNSPGPEKPRKAQIATQKTFSFPARTSPEKIDEVINKWLMEQALKGCPAMIGKVYGERGLFGRRIFFQYLYSRFIDVNK